MTAPAPAWDVERWPWERDGIRLLPVLHGRLEFARAVRAHLDAFDPAAVVVEVPVEISEAWRTAVVALPRLSVVRVEATAGAAPEWLLVEPTDPAAEASRWALERQRPLVAGDRLAAGHPVRRTVHPDTAALPGVGYVAWVRAWTSAQAPAADIDRLREQNLARVAREAAEAHGRVALVCGLDHLAGVVAALDAGAAVPLLRPARPAAAALPLHVDSLPEVLTEMPFVQAAWERGRAGDWPCRYEPPERGREPAPVLAFPGVRAPAPAAEPAVDPDEEVERRAAAGGADLLARPRLVFRLVQQAERLARDTSGSEPTPHERRVLHRFARNLALTEGALTPDLYTLVVAARGAVDDSFARDLLRHATHWPWADLQRGGVRLRADDLGLTSRLVTLRPKIDRLARRPGLAAALRRAGELWRPGERGICSHVPEDILVEDVGARLRRIGGVRADRAGVQRLPFTTSLLDGLDARETLRRYVVDGRPWVREEIAVRSEVGAVVVIFDDDEAERYPWRQVWHGEHQNESDMAFYATDPAAGEVAPGIHRAEYGGLLMIWPPLRMGDVWHEPAYRFCRSKPEVLLVAGLDYSETPVVVFVARRPPRSRLLALARRLGKRVVHVPPGVLSREMLRRVRTFHVLEGRHLRPLAEHLIDPPS